MTNTDDDYSGIEIHAEESSSYVPAPAGTHVARCISLIQLGTQKQEFDGKPGKDRSKIVLGFELPEELCVFDEARGEQPYFITNTYNLVLGEKRPLNFIWKAGLKVKLTRNLMP
jgi:hypothetical protein